MPVFRLPEDTIPLIMQISPHRKIMAILEQKKGYDTNDSIKKKENLFSSK